MKRCIITGPTGTIGVALADLLTQEGWEVTAVVRPGSPNVKNLIHHPNLRLVVCDIAELSTLKDRLEGSYDAFWHLAWNGTFGADRNHPGPQMDNVRYTLDALEAAVGLGCEVFVGAGSQAEFGHYDQPAGEQTPTMPFSLYGAAKLAAGHLSRIHGEQLGIRHVWVRIFSVFGPADDERTLISHLIREIGRGNSPEMTEGEQIWDYLYSYDAAKALILVGAKGKPGAMYSLGSGIGRPLREHIMELRDLVDPSVPIGFGEKPYGSNQVMHLCADIRTLREDTGFVPEHTFSEGILEMLKGRERTK